MRAVGAFAIAALLAGCGVLPQPPDPFEALNAWPPSATIGEDGTAITATYQDWPLPGAPHAFACARPPAKVFGNPPAHDLVIATDPACRPFDVRQAGRELQLRLDRQGLPAAFAGLESWTVILAVEFDESTWQASTVLPVVFPGLQPAPAPS
jgi:hypothetical protein